MNQEKFNDLYGVLVSNMGLAKKIYETGSEEVSKEEIMEYFEKDEVFKKLCQKTIYEMLNIITKES